MDYEKIITALVGFIFASNGILIYMIKRRDKVSILMKMNNRQAGQISMLNAALLAVLGAMESLVDALHDKNVLNGNAEKVKDNLRSAKSTIDEYARKICKEQIMVEDR